MSLEEALQEGIKVSRSEAIAEIEDHGLPIEDFFAEVGDKPEYSTREVLNWLGY